MQNPEKEMPTIIHSLTTASAPKILHETVLKYYTPTASLIHPLSYVVSAPGSREKIIGVYEWYRILSPQTDSIIKELNYNKEAKVMTIFVEQTFGPRFSPFKARPSSLLVRLVLEERNGKFYISEQQDYFQPTELATYIAPPLQPIVKFVLTGFATTATICARMYMTGRTGWKKVTGSQDAEVNAHKEMY